MKLEKDLADKQIKIVYGKDLADEVWTDRPALPCHPVLVPDEALFGQNVSEKLAAVRKDMAAHGASGLFLSKLDDLMWLLNIRGADVECNPVALSYACLLYTSRWLPKQPRLGARMCQGTFFLSYRKLRFHTIKTLRADRTAAEW